MPDAVALTRRDTRRLAVAAQLLTAARPADIIEIVDGLAAVTIDPTTAVAASADLVLWSRLGWPYQPADLGRLVEVDRAVFEWRGAYRPVSDLAMLLPLMAREPRYRTHRDGLEANARNVTQLLEILTTMGVTAVAGRDARAAGAGTSPSACTPPTSPLSRPRRRPASVSRHGCACWASRPRRR